MTAPSFSAEALSIALSNITNLVRESWRLQIVDPKTYKLPESMLPTEKRAREDLAMLLELESHYDGDMKAWMEQAVQAMKSEHGPINRWVKQNLDKTDLDWDAMIADAASAVAAAKECSAGAALDAYSWEKASRAAHTLGFVLRAIEGLKDAQERGEIPVGSRAAKVAHETAVLLRVRLYDSEDKMIGDGDCLETSLRDAKRNMLSSRPLHTLTPEEFAFIAKPISVEVGRGKSGKALTGPKRLLFSDFDDQSRLMSFFLQAYINNFGDATNEASRAHQDEWVGKQIKNAMSKDFDTDLRSIELSGVGAAIFIKNGIDPVTAIKRVHLGIVRGALEKGLEVPERVLAAVADYEVPSESTQYRTIYRV